MSNYVYTKGGDKYGQTTDLSLGLEICARSKDNTSGGGGGGGIS